jgi:nucleotidyltransferase substrate binding protein (TIGR01987 family)
MTKNAIINRVKEIILKHANPNRIYLYGSQVNGEATKGSDIDIAYDDENFKREYLIKDEIESIETLTKIDVQNIARCDDRFKNRVISTAKVVYSSSKKLRAEDGLYNFSNALKRFNSAINQKDELINEGFEDIYLDLMIKRFEFTYEMSWKALKRYLDYLGIEAKSPRATFKEGFSQTIIEDEKVWLDMIEHRNLSSHVYDEYQIKEILDKIDDYKEAFNKLKNSIEDGLNNS